MEWEFNYAGVELPIPDRGGIGLELQPIDNAERNANGDLLIEAVAMKYKLPYTRSQVNGEEAHLIFSTLKKNRTGKLRFYDISEKEMTEKNVYWGAGAKINYLHWNLDLTKSLYGAISVNFIEV